VRGIGYGWLFLLLAATPAIAQTRVELYTMGPGDELFSKFGHAALCVVAPELPAGGVCYNYGTSDFSRPIGLGWDVVRGRAKFWVSVSDWISMMLSFQSQQRSIYRQVLPLSDEQVAELVAALETDALPENREYRYSHFLDNCSTRPRDLIDAVSGGALRRSSLESTRSYRDYAREGLAALHWGLVPAGDLILGRWVDQDIDIFEAMFIPEVLAQGVTAELGVVAETVYERPTPAAGFDVEGALFRFWWVVGVLAALSWISRRFTRLTSGVIGLAGVVLWAAAVASPWPELRVNELALVLVPLDLVWLRRSGPSWYANVRLAGLALVALLAVAGVLIQPLWPYWALAVATLASFWWHARKDILAA
jgi:hypothetical protein